MEAGEKLFVEILLFDVWKLESEKGISQPKSQAKYDGNHDSCDPVIEIRDLSPSIFYVTRENGDA